MKTIIVTVGIIACTTLSSCNAQLSNELSTATPHWEITWQDDFSGSELNTACWSKIPRGTSDWNKHMSDNDHCYELKDGKLILKGIKNTVDPTDKSKYLTGGVYTKTKKNIKYGKVEVCARFEHARGAWPAIWMLPETGEWPLGGEIDIMEHLNHDKKVYQTVHSYYIDKLFMRLYPKYHTTAPFKVNEYNVYGVEISPTELKFYVNGSLTFEYPRIDTKLKGQYPFGTPFYLLVDMQLGGSWVGAVKDKELPVNMYIDWVKFYEKK
nr:glycoside hydrolase family 16 protein [Porphyromonas pogonae]